MSTLISHRITALSVATLLSLSLFSSNLKAGDNDNDRGTGSRVSAELDYKIRKGFHVNVSEELRFSDFSAFDRSYSSVGISYKINPYLKIGGAYTAIGVQEYAEDSKKHDSDWIDWRHRFNFDVTGMYTYGRLKFSLRERIQSTTRTKDINEFQKPSTEIALKSRFKVSYQVKRLEPYASVELRTLLNGARWMNDQYVGHTDRYNNRIRVQLGTEWIMSKKNSFEFYVLHDNLTDRVIDSNAEGTKLKSYEVVKSSHMSVGIGYKFSF